MHFGGAFAREDGGGEGLDLVVKSKKKGLFSRKGSAFGRHEISVALTTD